MIRKSLTHIDHQDAGKTVIEFLAKRFTYLDRSQWLQQCAENRLVLNGSPTSPNTILKPADILEFFPEPRPEPPIDDNVSLLHAIENLAFIAKSPNLPCHPAGRFFNNTLWAMLKNGSVASIPPQDSIHFISRLDRETSGIVLVAWSPDTAKKAAKAITQPNAIRQYKVLVEGDFPDTLDADGFLWSSPTSTVAKKRYFSTQQPPPEALKIESARTIFQKVRSANGLSELQATLVTGRTHQIRATLCSLGYPVVGDKIYGVDETIFLRFIKNEMTETDKLRLRLPRQALHAERLAFTMDNLGFLDVSNPIDFFKIIDNQDTVQE